MKLSDVLVALKSGPKSVPVLTQELTAVDPDATEEVVKEFINLGWAQGYITTALGCGWGLTSAGYRLAAWHEGDGSHG